MISVTVNGEEQKIEQDSTVGSLVDDLGAGRRGIAAAVNSEVVPRSEWDRKAIATGDKVEILRAVQGGC